MVLLSFALNMLIAWCLFMLSGYIVGFMGQNGLKATSKVFSLLLAAIAVSMIIRGLDLAVVIILPARTVRMVLPIINNCKFSLSHVSFSYNAFFLN